MRNDGKEGEWAWRSGKGQAARSAAGHFLIGVGVSARYPTQFYKNLGTSMTPHAHLNTNGTTTKNGQFHTRAAHANAALSSSTWQLFE
jgi:hypothetical protein